MMTRKSVGALLAALMLSALGACGGSSDSNPPPPPPAAGGGTITGKVVSREGQPIANATVSAGNRSTSSNAAGLYTLSAVAAGTRVAVKAVADNYAETLKTTAVSNGSSSTIDLPMLAVGATASIDPAAGGTVSMNNSPAQVTLPAAGLARVDGSAINGAVKAQITPINPALDSKLMPADFTTIAGDGTARTIESYGALVVNLTDAQGVRVNLANGKSSTIRIPVGSRSSARPASIPLYYLDEASGRWVEQGSAALSPDSTYYEGTVSHFSTWNADFLYDSVNVVGCVLNAQNAPAPAGVTVGSDGIDYSGTSSVLTDAQGCYTLPIKSGGKAEVTAVLDSASGLQFSNSLSAGPSGTTINLAPLVLAAQTNSVKIKLTWGQAPLDVDSHLVAPDGSHVYYVDKGSLTGAPFANLDVDDVDSFGPEIVTIPRLMVGTYNYVVNNFSATDNPGMTASPVKVELIVNGQTTQFSPAAGEGTSLWWHAFDLTVDAQCKVTVTPRQLWLAALPSQSGTPTFCTP